MGTRSFSAVLGDVPFVSVLAMMDRKQAEMHSLKIFHMARTYCFELHGRNAAAGDKTGFVPSSAPEVS